MSDNAFSRKGHVHPLLWWALAATLSLNLALSMRGPIATSVQSIVSTVEAKRYEAQLESRWLEQMAQTELSTETLDKAVNMVNDFQQWFGVGPYEQRVQDKKQLLRAGVVNH